MLVMEVIVRLQDRALCASISGRARPEQADADVTSRSMAKTHAPSRLIVTEVDVAVFAVAFRGPMGWLPNRLPAASVSWSGFRSRCRPVGSRRGVARKRSER